MSRAMGAKQGQMAKSIGKWGSDVEALTKGV